MTTVKSLEWKKTASKPDRWQGVSGLGLVYVVTQGANGEWLWGRADQGWHGPEKSLEVAKGLCQSAWSESILGELLA